MRILLIEDDDVIASFILKGMKEAGHAVLYGSTGTAGLDLALNENFDVAIVDIMLPGPDGLEIVERMRSRELNAPVLMLSARRSVSDIVLGLRKGGDDYLTKPFSFTELLARVDALLRRTTDAQVTTVLKADDLELDLLSRKVYRAGIAIELQPKEFSLLEYLMKNSDQIVSKTMIIERVWNYNFNPDTNVVEARISKLREKVDKGFKRSLIRTVRGAGYMLQSHDV